MRLPMKPSHTPLTIESLRSFLPTPSAVASTSGAVCFMRTTSSNRMM